MADPHPAMVLVGTGSDIRRPSGSPGTMSRVATKLSYQVAPANPSAAARRIQLLGVVAREVMGRFSPALQRFNEPLPATPVAGSAVVVVVVRRG